jgi:hypothetical protein
MQGPEVPGFFRVTRWVTDATGWGERRGYAGGEPSINSDIIDEVTSTSCRASLVTAPACTTSRMGPCACRRTWVGDDPNAATNLRFRATYEH